MGQVGDGQGKEVGMMEEGMGCGEGVRVRLGMCCFVMLHRSKWDVYRCPC